MLINFTGIPLSISNCSPPDTVVGIETQPLPNRSAAAARIVALLIPLSVLKPSECSKYILFAKHCSPPDTVVGIETSFSESCTGV